MLQMAGVRRQFVKAAMAARFLERDEERALAVSWRDRGDEAAQRLARVDSYSDRMRYYWPDPEVERAVTRLLANLAQTRVPLPMLSRFLPLEYARVRAGRLAPDPRALILDHIAAVFRDYLDACAAAQAVRA